MPIYEYLCKPCNRVFSFISPTINPRKPPTCPKCGARDLKKTMSRFAVVGAVHKSEGKAATEKPAAGANAPGGPDSEAPFDDPRVEHEMERLMQDTEGLDENDPRQLGHLMRRMKDITGEDMGPEMETAIRRLEAGEDPEKIEEDMGDLLGDEGGPGGPGAGPDYDNGLYPM